VIRLDMSDEEADELRTALSVHLHELRAELTGTEARDYKADLRKRLDCLEGIAARLMPTDELAARR
jgi:hypothetical protein